MVSACCGACTAAVPTEGLYGAGWALLPLLPLLPAEPLLPLPDPCAPCGRLGGAMAHARRAAACAGYHGAAGVVAQTTMIRGAPPPLRGRPLAPAAPPNPLALTRARRAACQRQDKDRLSKLVRAGKRAVEQSGRRLGACARSAAAAPRPDLTLRRCADDLVGDDGAASALTEAGAEGRQTELDLSAPPSAPRPRCVRILSCWSG